MRFMTKFAMCFSAFAVVACLGSCVYSLVWGRWSGADYINIGLAVLNAALAVHLWFQLRHPIED